MFFKYFTVYSVMADCIFCNIAQGKVATFKVYENDSVVAFLDINPGNKGQVVLAPKKHVQGIHELSPSDVGKVFAAVRLIVLGMSQSLGCEGVNVIYSLGAQAGQRSDHMIIYILPRYKDDKVIIHWEPKQGDQEELKQVADLLDKAIKAIPDVVSRPKPKVVEEGPEPESEVIEDKPRVPDY